MAPLLPSSSSVPSLLLCVLLFVLTVSFVDAGRRMCSADDYRAGAPKHGNICGKVIPMTLSLVCQGSYRSPGKRDAGHVASPWSLLNNDDESWIKKQDSLDPNDLDPAAIWDDVFLPRASALSVLRPKRSTMRSGVYCECCVHSCSYSEMLAYCGTDRRKRSTDDVTTDILAGLLTEDNITS